MTPQDFIRRCRADLPFSAQHRLKVRPKVGALQPLIFNTSQLAFHEAIEGQKRRTGMVRALVLKGRQLGISTYTAARFYSQATLTPDTRVMILAHEQDASNNLFAMVTTFYDNDPLAPSRTIANEKQMILDKVRSEYRVATAGGKPPGRGQSIRLLHFSEAAFVENAEDIAAATLQTVPELPGTEIIVESTAKGPRGWFYEQCQRALRGEGDYILVFLPWWLEPAYRTPLPRPDQPGYPFVPGTAPAPNGDLSEADYAQAHGLDHEQMLWRRKKIETLGHDRFAEEYPATPQDAFRASTTDGIMRATDVLRARRSTLVPVGPKIMGVDPAGDTTGADSFAVAIRQGHVIHPLHTRQGINALEAVEWLAALIEQEQPSRVFLDVGGLGQPILTMLRAKNPRYTDLVRGVNFGAKSQAKMARPKAPGPVLRRDEMYQRFAAWLTNEEGARLPDDDGLQAELTSITTKPSLTNDFKLVGKDDIRKLLGRSPDCADACALTFASLEFLRYTPEPPPARSLDTPETFMAQDNPIMPDYSFGGAGNFGWMS